MDSLLKHMVNLTAHREHTELDIAVISAVQELTGATQARVLTISSLHKQQFVFQRAIIWEGIAVCTDESLDHGTSLAAFPELAACMKNFEMIAEAVSHDGKRTLWAPIWIRGKAQTSIEIEYSCPNSAKTRSLISSIISIYRNVMILLDYSERDSLTGLLNRKTFDERLALMCPAPSKQSVNLRNHADRRVHMGTERQWLAVVDIDGFKLVNDRFGHLMGDQVLIQVAKLLQLSCRSQDRVFRFGGEEFVVLLHSTILKNAQKIIDRLREDVEAHEFPGVGRVTVSVGFVGFNSYESPIVSFGHADQALYYAKCHGRNQTSYYDHLVESGLLQVRADPEAPT